MFARVVKYPGQPNKLQDAIREWEKHSTLVDSMKGLQNVYALTDKKTGSFTIVSFWDTEEDLNASAETIMPIRDGLARVFGLSSLPTPETYEVSSERGRRMRKAA